MNWKIIRKCDKKFSNPRNAGAVPNLCGYLHRWALHETVNENTKVFACSFVVSSRRRWWSWRTAGWWRRCGRRASRTGRRRPTSWCWAWSVTIRSGCCCWIAPRTYTATCTPPSPASSSSRTDRGRSVADASCRFGRENAATSLKQRTNMSTRCRHIARPSVWPVELKIGTPSYSYPGEFHTTFFCAFFVFELGSHTGQTDKQTDRWTQGRRPRQKSRGGQQDDAGVIR